MVSQDSDGELSQSLNHVTCAGGGEGGREAMDGGQGVRPLHRHPHWRVDQWTHLHSCLCRFPFSGLNLTHLETGASSFHSTSARVRCRPVLQTKIWPSFQTDLYTHDHKVIKGWDIGVSTMRVGEVATLFIKSHYGYGSAGSPPKVFTLYSSKSLQPPFRFPEMLHWSLRLSFSTFMGKTSQRFRSLFC